MLEDYIKEYKEAWQNYDREKCLKIEKELQILGVDKYTLMVLMREV